MTKEYIDLIINRAKESGKFEGAWNDYVFKEIQSNRTDSGIENSKTFYIEFNRPMWDLDGVFREYGINENFHYLSLVIL